MTVRPGICPAYPERSYILAVKGADRLPPGDGRDS